MIALRKLLSIVLSSTLLVFTLPSGTNAQTTQPGQPPPSYSGQGQPLSQEELQGLVAPIALYPDALVAQILAAATYPDQVAIASYWLSQNKNLTGSALMNAVNQQTWDPAVKALTQFPSVLNNMAQNLTWTSSLGEAYHNQQSDVMSAIQTLRAKAKAAGNLKSGSQITVVQQSPQTIVIEPANPQVIYVPQYNPTVVYGAAVVTPGYSTADLVATGLLSFGAGIAVGAMMSGGCCGWGYSAWHCNWYGGYGGGVYYHGAAYYGNAAWHGGYYGDSYYHNGYYGNNYNNYYHNGSYNNSYNNGYHNYNNSYNNSGYSHTGDTNYTHNTSGNTVNVNNMNTSGSHGSSSWGQGDKWGGWGDSGSSRGWGQSGGGGGSSAFSGWGSHSGSDGGGWGSRSASSRGWGGGGGGGGGGGWGGGGGGFGGRR